MTSRWPALIAVPFVLMLAACGGGSSSGPSSSAAPASSSAAPTSASASPSGSASFSPECAKTITALQTWYLDQAGVAIALTSAGAITPEVKTGMEELATKTDGYADDLESGIPDAPPAFAKFAGVMRQEAEVLRTWPETNTTTDGLAAALDAVTTSDAATKGFQDVITDLESRCAPWTWG